MNIQSFFSEKWESKRFRRNFIALASTISINLLITIIGGFFASVDTFIGLGLVFAPLIGGIGRGIIANRRDLRFITPVMAILDILIFVPAIIVLVGFDDYRDGIGLGLLAALIMMLSNLITAIIRILVDQMRPDKEEKNSLEEKKIFKKTEN
jgi:hypothetical protein